MTTPIVLPLAYRSQEHDDWGYIRDATRRVIAVARYDTELSEDDLHDFRRRKADPSEPEARLIIRSVNAHDDLVAALKAMVDRWEPDCVGNDRRMWEDACAALAKAEG